MCYFRSGYNSSVIDPPPRQVLEAGELVPLTFPHAGMVRYCGALRDVIFFLSMVPRATGDVRGVFGGPFATCSSNMFGVVSATIDH